MRLLGGRNDVRCPCKHTSKVGYGPAVLTQVRRAWYPQCVRPDFDLRLFTDVLRPNQSGNPQGSAQLPSSTLGLIFGTE